MVSMCSIFWIWTYFQIGYRVSEHSTILCRHPGISTWAPSVNTALDSVSHIRGGSKNVKSVYPCKHRRALGLIVKYTCKRLNLNFVYSTRYLCLWREVCQRIILGVRRETNNKLNPHMMLCTRNSTQATLVGAKQYCTIPVSLIEQCDPQKTCYLTFF